MPYYRQDSHRALEALTSISGVNVLIDRAIEIPVPGSNGASGGEVCRVYGSPWVPRYAAWKTAFNKDTSDLETYWSR